MGCMEYYAGLRFLHLTGFALLAGATLNNWLLCRRAVHSNDGRIIAHTGTLVLSLDLSLGLPAYALSVLSGLGFAWIKHVDYEALWLLAGLALSALYLLVWLLFILPTQIRQGRIALSFAGGGVIPADYTKTQRLLVWLRFLQLMLVLGIAFFMVFRFPA